MSTTEVLDLSSIEATAPGQYPPMPEDRYMLRVTDTAITPSKKGEPMYTLKLTVEDGEFKNRNLWHRRVVNAKTGGFVKADVLALNIAVPGGMSTADIVRYIAKEARGRLVMADVGFGTGDYADRNEIKALYNETDSAAMTGGSVDANDI